MKRRPISPLAAPIALVAVVAVALVALSGRDRSPASPTVTDPKVTTPTSTGGVDPTSPASTDPGQPGAPEDGTRQVLLLVDGWSARTLDGAPLWVDAGPAGRQDLRLVPLDAATVADLRARHPEALGAVVARMTPVGPLAGCTPERCVDGAGAVVSDTQLADATTIGGLGPVFADWGVTAAVWAAELTVDADTLTIQAHTSRSEWSPAQLVVNDPEAAEGETLPTQVLAVGAGLGQLFPLTPGWVGDAPYVGPISPAALAAAVDPSAPVPFVSGLAAVEPAAANLDPAWLTYLTSPSTGCGAGVLCAPVAAAPWATVTTLARETRAFCADSNGARVEVDFVDARWQIDYPHQTHQGGAWYGVTPDAVAGDSMLFAGTPALVSGTAELRVTTARIVDGGGSHALRGQVLHLGFDRPESIDTPAGVIFDRLLRVPEGFTAC